MKTHIDRFWDRVEVTDSCWLWTGSMEGVAPRGPYGLMCLPGKTRVRAHRFSYELHVGRIPDGLVLDHLCRNPPCVNPAHLEPVTLAENSLRGTSPNAINARKTHCIRGHLLAGANVYLDQRGHRGCRECKRAADRRYAAERRARAAAGIVDAEHGLLTTYNYHGCRCDECREARLAYQRQWRRGGAA